MVSTSPDPSRSPRLSLSRRLFSFLGCLISVVGTLGCVVALLLTWWVSYRISEATQRSFELADQGISHLTQFTDRTEQRIGDLKISTDRLGGQLQSWVSAKEDQWEPARSLVSEEIGALSQGLQKADHFLELTQSPLSIMQNVSETLDSAGVSKPKIAVQKMADDWNGVKSRLDQATAALAEVEQKLQSEVPATERASNQPVATLSQMVVRIGVTLGNVDERLDTFKQQINQVQHSLQQGKETVKGWERTVTVLMSFVWVWMAAGQVALFYLSRGLLFSVPLPPET